MRTPNTPYRAERTQEEQIAAENGPIYCDLKDRFVNSFPMEKRVAAAAAFRQIEAKYQGWSPEVEKEARRVADAKYFSGDISPITTDVVKQTSGIVQPADSVAGNEAEHVAALGGFVREEGMRVSFRAPAPEKDSPAGEPEEPPMGFDDMKAEMIAKFGEEETARRIKAIMDSTEEAPVSEDGKSADATVQTAYEHGARRAG